MSVTQRSSGAFGLNCRWGLLGDTILAVTNDAKLIGNPPIFNGGNK